MFVNQESPHDAIATLRGFLTALNQWQRDSYLRFRLDNYEFTGKALRVNAIERSLDELGQDWSRLASRFISSDCRFYRAPLDVLSHPPVFDGFESRQIVRVPENTSHLVTLETTSALNSPFRFLLDSGESGWRIAEILAPPELSDKPWQKAYLV